MLGWDLRKALSKPAARNGHPAFSGANFLLKRTEQPHEIIMRENENPGPVCCTGSRARRKPEFSSNSEVPAQAQASYLIEVRWRGDIRRLRWLLKTLGRRFSIAEERP